MKEEDYILRKVGKDNHFQTPEGYFDNLTSEIMNRLPEKDYSQMETEVSMWQKAKPLLYMAAVFVGAAFILRLGGMLVKNDPEYIAAEEEQLERQYIDQIVNDSMMDDYTFYQLLSEVD